MKRIVGHTIVPHPSETVPPCPVLDKPPPVSDGWGQARCACAVCFCNSMGKPGAACHMCRAGDHDRRKR